MSGSASKRGQLERWSERFGGRGVNQTRIKVFTAMNLILIKPSWTLDINL